MDSQLIMESKLGRILLEAKENKLTGCHFTKEKETSKQADLFLFKVKEELEEYFSGQRKEFDIPLAPQGTDFQKKVWKALQNINYGTTASYKEIAQKINNPKAVRAVGMANNQNPIAIIIPCHRVIGSNGKLVGYAGGLELKQKLLELEKNNQ